jgi:hypothetical protein
MKLLLALCLLGLAAGSEDYKMFMKWAKTKAMESCWGEDNMKIHTVNMKKAVAKCNQQDAPELDLPPFRAINRMINNLVGMASYKEDQHGEIEDFKQFLQYYEIAKMMNKDHESHGNYQRDTYQPYSQNYKEVSMRDGDMGMEKMKMMMMMMKMKKMMDERRHGDMDMDDYKKHDDMSAMFRSGYKKNTMDEMPSMLRFFAKNKMDKYEQPQDDYSSMESMFRSMGKMRFKRQADDSLALNDRLKEKLEHMMNEHVEQVSNMTCVLREMNVIDQNNNIDVKAMKKDAKQYKLPSAWFGERYEEILDSCYQVAENLPAGLQDKVLPNNYNGPMRNLGKIKSFMNCCKSAKMKLCMYQDTKKKIETNFGPVDQLLEGFNNQITEEQVFYMVNELLQGDDDEFM